MTTTSVHVDAPFRGAAERESIRALPGDPEPIASAFLADYAAREQSAAAYLRGHLREFVAAREAIGALPGFDADLGETSEGMAVRAGLRTTPAWRTAFRGVRSVLVLPASGDRYLEGPDRATVRRKHRAAERAGLRFHAVTSLDERIELLEIANEHERLGALDSYRTNAPDNDDLLGIGLWLVATDADGTPIMLAVMPVDSGWATLRYYRTLQTSEHASLARYWMMSAVVDALVARGVRVLADTADPRWLPMGLRHYQRMIGFRLARVRLVG